MSSSIKGYFERNKRDLSVKSTNEEERKKTRESSLDLSLSKETNDDTDILTEGIESLSMNSDFQTKMKFHIKSTRNFGDRGN